MLSFYLLLLFQHGAHAALLRADRGQNVTLPCFFTSNSKYLSWYKQVAGAQPQIISSIYKHIPSGNNFYNQFKDKDRFSVETGAGFYHLVISNVQDSDSAMYYCGHTSITVTEFHEGIFVVLREASVSLVQQPGDSVTLSCTVHTGGCDGGHSVYWFKDSEESHPGLIYTHGGRNHQCERRHTTETNTCVYNLPLRSLNVSHAGTYYCAVVSCGHILFGNGYKLNTEFTEGSFLSGALTFTSILSALLALTLFMMKRSEIRKSDTRETISAPFKMNAEHNQNKLNLYYAALSVDLANTSRQERDQTWSECVYYSVKQ